MQKTQAMQIQSLGWGDPLEEGKATYSSVLHGESHGQRSLVGYSPWGRKELDTIDQLTLSFLKRVNLKCFNYKKNNWVLNATNFDCLSYVVVATIPRC